jgi:epsin
LNEIMPMIYRRFTEKAAEEWRQIYKALQLLEFLIKHGSERVVDDARGHLTLLKMLRQFHFIDQSGKDQGINVRNRAKELAELLGDVDRIRSERKKARATKNKYTGVEGGTFGGGGFSGGSRYGGFGPESSGGPATFGGYSGGVYGDGGGFGGQSSDYQESGGRSDRFEEYDEFDEADRPAASSRSTRRSDRSASKKAEPPKPKEPEVDLFSFDEPASSSAAPAAAPAGGSSLADLAKPSNTETSNNAANDDDEFDDFQSAAPSVPSGSSTQFAAPQPVSAPKQADLTQMMNLSSISPAPSSSANYAGLSVPPSAPSQPQTAPAAQQQAGPNYFGGVQSQSSAQASTPAMTAMPTSTASSGPTTMANARPVQFGGKAAAPAAGGDAFGALWGKASAGIKKSNTPTAGPTMGQLAKEKSSAGIWGAPATSSNQGSGASGGSTSGDLLG